MRIVTVTAVPFTRISNGSSTTRVSGLAHRVVRRHVLGSATRRHAAHYETTRSAAATPAEDSNRITTAFETGVFDFSAT